MDLQKSRENEIVKLLEENLRVNRQILEKTKKIERWVFWQKVKNYIYLFLIIIPIALAFLYLPPILKDAVDKYQKFMGVFLPAQEDIIKTLKNK